ncbi:di-trans,poly-cis-decaprenylcistransferase [Helicobacter apodemus]|uniref:Isoprenyl transferase n=1 Tax=Helicobacter apodemus TaxID=135569 RepID=A0A4U8UHH3_9HELI|nr:di-trans,poly-cis-decaprenylcistransferase [Helicobacter apodemus]TLE16059.1 di-trans,poly-cis-decaprenylcistransferase [Helicobacter apodemus]
MEVKHLAIIMDGNGRWAQKRLKPRFFGHQEGAKKIQNITESCLYLGIKYLSLYAFSTENWKRPQKEIDFLIQLLNQYLTQKKQIYLDSNIRFRSIGDISIFPQKLQAKIKELENFTKHCNKLTQILALNYGSKDELRRTFLKLHKNNSIITQESITQSLDTADFPEVDMLIRTGGEQRLSNFLLWQSAYAELFFTKTLWPDFSHKELAQMLEEFSLRQRRFGGI